MITKQEIDEKAAQFSLSPQSVEKDYVFGWFLQGLYTRSRLASDFVLKGGNALRKGYLEETRFSRDLDFSLRNGIDGGFLKEELHGIARYVSDCTGVEFELGRTDIRDKSLPQVLAKDVLEARIYFKGFYGEENISLKAQLDITQFDQILLPVQERELIHPYSDRAECGAVMHCQKSEEILASKLVCLLHRGKAGDLYDLAKLLLFQNPYEVNRLEVVRTFLSKSVYQADQATARRQLLEVSLDKYRIGWGDFIVPRIAMLSFEAIVAGFPALINSLFSLITPQARKPVVAPRVTRGGLFGGYAGGYGYFASDFRNTIISAGRSRKMVRMRYDGIDRLVEPYAIEYYVRKRDHRGSEYFWGYDTSGGRSGKQSIKQFLCEKIQSVSLTTADFVPRFSIEL